MKKRIGPDGVHFFDRRTGLNLLFDETRPPSDLWSEGPRQVSVALTDRCDLRCPHCYAPKTANRLELVSLRKWLLELDAAGTLGVGFGGGEPTLFADFIELCRFVANETALAVSFTTHGHHLDDELIRQLHGNVHFFRISVDGVGAIYEQMRGRTFKDLLNALGRARRLAPFGVNMVVNEFNVHQLGAVASAAADAGASELLILPQQQTSSSGAASGSSVRKASDWATQYSGPLRLSVGEVSASEFPICEPLPSEIGMRAYVHIDAAGYLRANSFGEKGKKISAAGVLAALSALSEETA